MGREGMEGIDFGSCRSQPGLDGYPGVVGSPGRKPNYRVSLSGDMDLKEVIVLKNCVLPRWMALGLRAGPSG